MNALLLLALVAAAQEAAQKKTDDKKHFEKVDSVIAEAVGSLGSLEDCYRTHLALKDDLAKKRKELSAEFKGQIPDTFNDLLTTKKKRADRQELECMKLQQAPAPYFDAAHQMLQSFDPPGHPGVVARRKKLADARQKYNRIISLGAGKSRGAPAPAKP